MAYFCKIDDVLFDLDEVAVVETIRRADSGMKHAFGIVLRSGYVFQAKDSATHDGLARLESRRTELMRLLTLSPAARATLATSEDREAGVGEILFREIISRRPVSGPALSDDDETD